MEAYPVGKDRVGADYDVAYARRKPLEGALVDAARLEARDGLYPYRRSVEAGGECLDVLFETLARGVEQLRMVRLVGLKLCEARKGRRLEVAGGDASRRRIAREAPGCERAGRQKGRRLSSSSPKNSSPGLQASSMPQWELYHNLALDKGVTD